MLKSSDFKNLGITTYDSLMNIDIILNFNQNDDDYEYRVNVVGISDTTSPVYYAYEETIFMLKTGVPVYEAFVDSITLSEGVVPTELKTSLVIEDPLDTSPINLRGISMLNNTYKVSGLYTSDIDVPKILIPFELLKEQYFVQTYVVRGPQLHFYATDVDGLVQELNDTSESAVSLYDVEEDAYKVERLVDSLPIIIFTSVVLGASSLSFYFILRSSLISRIYEVSVYRALGVSKFDIRKMFVVEILLITTLTSLVGYLIMTYLLLRLQGMVDNFVEVFYISFLSLTGGIVLIYVVNLVSGLIPISNLLRKTPAEILSKYDF
jgi:ABC-type antimicrobial peptide transport system permease subunit